MKNFLFVDDDRELIEALRCAFEGKKNVRFLHTNHIDDAIPAIMEMAPDVIFLDHNLTEGGGEGLEIVSRLPHGLFTIYSTSSGLRPEVLIAYEAFGVVYIGKELKRMREIIDRG